jgi:hypothetical protein
MPPLPLSLLVVLAPFASCFSRRVWPHALMLVAGAILAPGRRTVAAALRAMGLAQERRFARYHRVLSRAAWSGLAVSRVLLGLLVTTFVPTGPLVIGIDETVERRWGPKIAAKGIYRDAARSSHSHFVKASGLRWICLMLLVPIPWAHRVWALPFLTALAPSERYDHEHGRCHKTLTDWAGQLLRVVRRWFPDRAIVAVADSTYAALAFLDGCRNAHPAPITVVTRLRLDAALFAPAPPRRPGQTGRPRLKGERLPTLATVAADPATCWDSLTMSNWYGRGERTLETVSDTAVWYHTGLPPVPLRWVLIRDPEADVPPQALLCTDLDATPAQIVAWFVQRWQVEVTFEEARRHLGVETQRQWSDRAIRRTTPALFGLISLVTLCAHSQFAVGQGHIAQAAWYPKTTPTFADALAEVRAMIWAQQAFSMSQGTTDPAQIPRALVDRFAHLLCYAA